MATLDDILTTQKNGVVAINNISQYLKTVNELTIYYQGTTTSDGTTSSGVIVAGKAGRLVSINVITAGTTQGTIYDYLTYTTTATSGTGATATVTYSGTPSPAFQIGDIVVVAGVQPTGYNTVGAGVAVTGIASQQIQYASTATGSQTTPGTIFQVNAANSICAVPNTIGTYQVGSQFTHGLYLILGTGQKISLTYSLD